MQYHGLARALLPGDFRLLQRLQASGLNESAIVCAKINKYVIFAVKTHEKAMIIGKKPI
jgi:hypothetical protein